MSAPPSSTEVSASLLGFGHRHRTYGYLCDFIRSHHEGLVLFVVSVPSPQGCSVFLCRSYLILHLDFSILDSRRCHRRSRESWKVHVKVLKLWYHKNHALDPSQNLLHMVLMDEKLHKIQAMIRDQLISNFAVSLNEGDMYLMTHFTIVPNTGLNRMMKHRFRLLFQYKTSVVSVVSPRIPHSGLCFTSIDEIDQMTKDDNFLIDFVGIITGVRKERYVASYRKLIKAVVLEGFTDGKKVQCNVFGNACDLLEYDKLQKYPISRLIVLESFKIKAIEGEVILQNMKIVSRLFINSDIPESVEFLSRFSIASYGFSRLVTNDLGYLVSKVDGDYFNPKEISNIQDLHADNGWNYSCVCGHAVVEHEDLYLCDACGSCVEHVMVKYGIRVKIQHGGCAVLFVLLDNAATKLFEKTCSEAFLRIEEEFPVDPSVLAKKVFKVEIHSAVDPDYSGCFKIVNAMLYGPIFPPIYDTYLQYATGEDYKTQVVCDNSIQLETIEDIITNLISPNRCYSDAENGGFVFILGTISSVLKNHKWWFSTCLYGSLVSTNKNILSCDLGQLQCIDAVPRFCLKVVVSHANENNIFVLKDREVVQIIKISCSSFLDNHPELNQGSYCKVVPLKLISSVLHKKVVFMIDARPVSYEMNRSVYIVQQVWDDASVINVFEAAAEMNEHKIHVLVDSIPEVEDAFSQCESDHEAVENLHAF
ncbi:Replication factor-A carboxy-terminal domain protein [Arachis hypogaea]|nr:Replication factor-A carboxy-terminal domain protein [Arachis hypogaea]